MISNSMAESESTTGHHGTPQTETTTAAASFLFFLQDKQEADTWPPCQSRVYNSCRSDVPRPNDSHSCGVSHVTTDLSRSFVEGNH